MTFSTTTDFDSEISALLDELSSVQTELLEVLNEKRRALVTADIAQLGELQPREERLSARLAECSERRAELLAAAKREGLPSESVGKLAVRASSGRPSKLGGRVKETA